MWVPVAVMLVANCYTPFSTFACYRCQSQDEPQRGKHSGRNWSNKGHLTWLYKIIVDIRLPTWSGAALGEPVWATVSILCCHLASHFEFTLPRVAHSWPLSANMTSSTKPRNTQHIATSSEEDRATVISRMHRKFGKVWTCGFGDIIHVR